MENTYVPRNLRMMYRSRILNIVVYVFVGSGAGSEPSVQFCHHFGLPVVEIAGLYVLAGFAYEP